MCVNLLVFFSQGYRLNEWTDWSVCGINRSGMICRLHLGHFRKNWLNNNEYISKKVKYFWSKKILCSTVFSYYVSRSSARDRITPSIPYTFSLWSYTGQRLRLAVPAVARDFAYRIRYFCYRVSTFMFLVTFGVDVFIRRRADRKTTFYLLSRLLQCCSRPYYIIYLYYNLWFFISKMISKTYKQKLRKRRNYFLKRKPLIQCVWMNV